MDISFKTEEELYKRLLPVLRIKKNKINVCFSYRITEEEIWKYLKDNIWCSKTNLTLSGMVEDILNIDNHKIIDFISYKI